MIAPLIVYKDEIGFEVQASDIERPADFLSRLASFEKELTGSLQTAVLKVVSDAPQGFQLVSTTGDHRELLERFTGSVSFKQHVARVIAEWIELRVTENVPVAANSGSEQPSQPNDSESHEYWIRPLADHFVLVSVRPANENAPLQLQDFIRNVFRARNSIMEIHKLQLSQKANNNTQNYLTSLATSLPLKEFSNALANDLCNYLNCDRVAVFELNNRSASAIAYSGQPKFNKRSNIVRIGEKLVGILAPVQEFWFTGELDGLPQDIAKLVQAYSFESLSSSFVILPLLETKPPSYPSDDEAMAEAIRPGSESQVKTVGAILVENFESPLDEVFTKNAWNEVKVCTEREFAKSKQFDSIFLIRLWLMFGWFAAFYRGQTRRKAILITAAVALLLLAAFCVPAEFKIRCEGYMDRSGTRDIYASEAGEVKLVNVTDGKNVRCGELLALIESSEILDERAEMARQLTAAEGALTKLIDQRCRRLNGENRRTSDRDVDNEEIGDLLARETEVSALKNRLSLMDQRIESGRIVAPYDGVIARWKAKRRLLGQRVESGHFLFSIIPHDSRVQLDLRIPGKRAQYVLRAWEQAKPLGKDLTIQFRLASEPSEQHVAKVTFVSPGLEEDRDLGLALTVIGEVDGDLNSANLREKTPVVAKIVCGTKPWGYCKSYELIDWFRKMYFEYLY